VMDNGESSEGRSIDRREEMHVEATVSNEARELNEAESYRKECEGDHLCDKRLSFLRNKSFALTHKYSRFLFEAVDGTEHECSIEEVMVWYH
ncbi:hypothetical protein PFISCL1PPCAC_6747, partial [Pristionchus fissidentatus]